MAKLRGIFEKVPGSGVWYIRYADATGRIRKEKAGTVATAKTLLTMRQHEAQIERKLPQVKRRGILFSEIAEDALEYSRSFKASHRDDTSRMGMLLPFLKDRPAESVTPQELQRLLMKQTRTAATFNRYRALLSLTYKLAMRNGKATSNPARSVPQRREKNERIRWITAEEEAALRTYILSKWPQHWNAVELALHTGMRMTEQFTLKWSQVDFDKRVLTLPETKNGRPRYIPLNDQAVAALTACHALKNEQPWVFLNRYGERLESPRVWFEKALEGCKLSGITWHTLRHTFASRLAMAGVELRTLQELLGHKTVVMTLRYTHLSPQHNFAAVQKLCDAQNGTDPKTDPDTKLVKQTGSEMVN